MKAGNSAAGNRNKHERPDSQVAGVQIGNRHFRQMVALDDNTPGNAQSHDDQTDTKNGINPADELVDGHKGG
ncbi:hypothetical protein SDC9_204732 [bioreactor metagenome]|uniref:Uncharacterized protein n=1 Tax=bioreactor metagenome TaxID=1076179 RepID=A0A645J037_9ZZZZ